MKKKKKGPGARWEGKREKRGPFPSCHRRPRPPPPPPRAHSIFRLHLPFLLGHPVGVSEEERVPEELNPRPDFLHT